MQHLPQPPGVRQRAEQTCADDGCSCRSGCWTSRCLVVHVERRLPVRLRSPPFACAMHVCARSSLSMTRQSVPLCAPRRAGCNALRRAAATTSSSPRSLAELASQHSLLRPAQTRLQSRRRSCRAFEVVSLQLAPVPDPRCCHWHRRWGLSAVAVGCAEERLPAACCVVSKSKIIRLRVPRLAAARV